jgi:hypothetical protein
MSDEIEVIEEFDFGIDVQEIMNEVVNGIDIEKRIVKDTHCFLEKLSALDSVFLHISMECEEDEVNKFLEDVIESFANLSLKLREFEKVEDHLILEEEAALSQGKRYVAKHKEGIARDLEAEKKVEGELLFLIQRYLKKIKELFLKEKELFKHLDGKIGEINSEDEEIKDVLQRLYGFVVTYEKIVQKAISMRKV